MPVAALSLRTTLSLARKSVGLPSVLSSQLPAADQPEPWAPLQMGKALSTDSESVPAASWSEAVWRAP